MELLTNILSYLNIWLSNIMEGYWLIIVLLCLAFIFIRSHKERLGQWIFTANRMYAIIALVAMITYLLLMLYNWFGPSAQEYKMFIGYRILGPWRWVFWLSFAGVYLLPQLYWIKKLSVFIPLIFIIILLMHADDIVEYYSQAYRDYYSIWWLPVSEISPWITYSSMLLFPLILFVYLYFRNRRR